MKPLIETKESFNFQTQLDESTGKKDFYIEGITLQSEIKNKNGRVYPKTVLREAIHKHTSEMLESGRAVGELKHPKSDIHEIDPENISHRFVEVKEDGNDFYTKAKILDTPKGSIVKNLLEGGVKLGISSRGFGDVKESKDAKVVQSLYLVSLGDIVTNPSAPNAFVNAVMENKEFVFENGIIVEKDLSQEIDEYKSIIQKASSKELQEAISNIFDDYMKKILKSK
jgi:hypothetical protein